MRKKLLTVALAATMTVASVFNSFAAELSSAWWTAWSESYEIADGATVEFDIDVKGGDAVWNNVAAVFTNSKITSTQATAGEGETTAAPAGSKDDVTPSKTDDTSAVAIVAFGAAVAVVASKKKVTE